MTSLFQWQGHIFLHERKLSFPLRDELCGLDSRDFGTELKKIVRARVRSAPLALRVGRKTVRSKSLGWTFGAAWRFVGRVTEADGNCAVEGWLILPLVQRIFALMVINLLLFAFVPFGIALCAYKIWSGEFTALSDAQKLLAVLWPALCIAMAVVSGLVLSVPSLWFRSAVEQDVCETLSA